MTMNGNSKKKIFIVILGALFIIIGVFFNEWVIASWLSYGGNLLNIDRILIWIFDIALISGGIWFIWKREKHSTYKVESKNLLLLAIVILIIFSLAEISSRIIDGLHDYDFSYNKEQSEMPIIPFRMFGLPLYEEKDGITYISSRHKELYKLKKNENTFRIVAIGGSTTQNLVEGVHYPMLLEELLNEKYRDVNVEVINIGNSGYSTPHFIILLSLDVITWDPDLIIVSENINDLLTSYFPDYAFDYSNKYRNEAFIPDESGSQRIFGWSRFYWVVRSRLEALSYRLADYKDDIYKRVSYGNNPPQLSQDIFRRNLETIISIAKANNVPVMLGTQPLEPSVEYWDRHMRYKKYNKDVIYPLHSEFVSHHNRFNEIIREVAVNKNISVVRNDSIFNADKTLFSDFVHYSRGGIERLAENYFDEIIRTSIIENIDK